jgi:hypothetical protein
LGPIKERIVGVRGNKSRDKRIYVRFRDKQMGENDELRKEVRVRVDKRNLLLFVLGSVFKIAG